VNGPPVPGGDKDRADNLKKASGDAAGANATGEAPCPLNKVKPQIETEYKLVVLDRKLTQHQQREPRKKLHHPDPTYVLVWVTQSNASENPWKKQGTVSVTGSGKVDLFLDEKCTKKFSGTLTAAQLAAGKKQKLWLRGTAAGKFKIKLALEDPGVDKILIEDSPAEVEMGVVELVLEVQEQDVDAVKALQVDPDVDPLSSYHTSLKDKTLPDQKKLSDEDKVKKGRLLHEQKDASFGRARLILRKLDGAALPDGVDDYEVVLDQDNVTGELAVFDKEFDGTKQNFPVKYKVSALKSADQTLWVEGAAKTKKWREARLELGLDRTAGNAPKKRKHNADWGRFTVVQITNVKLKYKAEKGKPVAWDKKKKRFYVNLKDGEDGRKVKITAEIEPKLQDVTVRFMLVEDKDNLKNVNGGTVPTTWKWKDIEAGAKHKDKADRKDLLHLSAKTTKKGKVEQELILSRCGAHKFTPACYLDQDPHLAKYIDSHADLGKRKPVLAEDTIEVWRKMWYQIAKPAGGAAPRATTSETAYENVHILYHTNAMSVFKKKHIPKNLRDRTFYPEWMIKIGGGNNQVAVIGGHNWHVFKNNHKKFFPMTREKKGELKKLTACIVVVDHQWDPKTTSLKTTKVDRNPSNWIRMSKSVVTPPLSGSLVQTGTWEIKKKSDGSTVDNGTLNDRAILVEKGRADLRDVKVKLPNSVDQYLAADKRADYDVNVSLKLAAGKSFLGESSGVDIMVVYDPSDPSDYFDTVSHETAHTLGHTFQGGSQPTGLPDHPYWNADQGTHCSHPFTPATRSPFQPMAGKSRVDHKCVMYEAGPVPAAGNNFCETCRKYFLIQEMTSF